MSFHKTLAEGEELEYVKQVCRDGRAMIRRGLTERYLDQVWQVSRARLGVAVYEHIELKRKVFAKLDADSRRIPGKMHANVTLAEDLDVYVEIELRGEEVVILAAHSHTPGMRLPR